VEKPKKPEASEESVTSLLRDTGVLTRLQSENLGVSPFEFPIHSQYKRAATPKYESYTSEITSPFPPFTSPFTSTQSASSQQSIFSTQTINTPTSSTSPIVSSSPSPSNSGSASSSSQHSTQFMANQPTQPWANPSAVLVANPNALPANPEKWLPKYNLDDGLLAEEHLNNFMLSMNLNGVTHEDFVIRLFPYTFQGSAGSWYF